MRRCLLAALLLAAVLAVSAAAAHGYEVRIDPYPDVEFHLVDLDARVRFLEPVYCDVGYVYGDLLVFRPFKYGSTELGEFRVQVKGGDLTISGAYFPVEGYPGVRALKGVVEAPSGVQAFIHVTCPEPPTVVASYESLSPDSWSYDPSTRTINVTLPPARSQVPVAVYIGLPASASAQLVEEDGAHKVLVQITSDYSFTARVEVEVRGDGVEDAASQDVVVPAGGAAQAEVPLARHGPGEYTVDVTVTDLGSGVVVMHQQLALTVPGPGAPWTPLLAPLLAAAAAAAVGVAAYLYARERWI